VGLIDPRIISNTIEGLTEKEKKIVDANEKLVKELKLCGDTTEASQR